MSVLDIPFRWLVECLFILEDTCGQAVNLLAKCIVDDAILVLTLAEGIGKCLADGVEGDSVNALVSFKYGLDSLWGHRIGGVDGVGVDQH